MNLPSLFRLAAVLPCLLLCSCMETPQEKLVGRWFNSSNSIWFTADGSVRWNSPGGMAQGTFTYDGSQRRISANEPVRNLALDLVRRNESLQPDFELEFLGHDRLRLTPMTESAETIRPLILKRAEEEDEETLPLAPIASEPKPAPGIVTATGN